VVVGRPRLVPGQDIEPGAVVIDAGYNAGNVGDAVFDSAVERAFLITPVPGAAAARQLGV
jgi:methylenetetrahydrofolate dehydrogenase (NADP+)/methenyltetrahydrofolate cyclohydrolase